MADTEVENILGLTDRRRTPSQTAYPIATEANYVDVAALRARLAVINAGYYTAARLNQMTKNDMVYAVRVADDAAGI